MSYAFGDSDVAAERLALLADTFADSSRVFMRESVQGRPAIAADLGCGPGHSTQLLADTVSPGYTVGLDNSESFIRLARRSESGNVAFRLHDITTEPFPSGPFDLLFSRFELTHLRERPATIELWGRQLKDRGLMLLEEVECIDTDIQVLQVYLALQQAMLQAQGNALYIGPEIDSIGDSASLRRRSSQVQTVRVPARRAAEMFHMNFAVWRESDFVKDSYDQAELLEIERGLAALSVRSGSAEPVEWGLRQIVVQRTMP